MDTHSFAFVVAGLDPNADNFEDIFYEAGCDDATLTLTRGAVAVCFDRESSSYKGAVLSAYEDIQKSGATILRFEPDYLVNAAEVAARAGLSRSAVSLYEKGERGDGYPAPFARITTSSPLWDWVEVSRWLCIHGKLDEDSYRHAQISRIINYNVQTSGSPARAAEELEKVLMRPVAA